MKKFAFSLETVYRYKEQVLDTLKNELARITAQIAELDRKIQELEGVFLSTNQRLTEQMRTGLASGDVAVYKIYLADINSHILTLNQKKREWQALQEKKKQEILAANTELAGMEKLKEKQWEEYRQADQKSQELFIEEFVSNAQFAQH